MTEPSVMLEAARFVGMNTVHGYVSLVISFRKFLSLLPQNLDLAI